jgi:hypothetical protein
VTLIIDRLVTRGILPRKLNFDAALVERVARERFAVECTRELKFPWPVQARVARIRQLRVRVTISAAQFTADSLAAAWTLAFVRELFAALSYPNGAEIVRFESRAEYLASAIRDLLTGVAAHRWVYEEFGHAFNLGTAGVAFVLFQEECSEIVPTLLILDSWSLLDRLLAVWDAATLERLFLAIESTNTSPDQKLSVKDLISVASLLLDHRSSRSGMDTSPSRNLGERKLALRLFLGLARESDWRNARVPSPLRIFRALCVLDAFLELRQAASAGRSRESMVSATFRELLEKLGSVTNPETRQNILNRFWNLFATASDTGRTPDTELLNELTSIFGSDSHRHQITQLWDIIGAESGERRTALARVLGELTSLFGSGNRPHEITQFWDIIVTGSSEQRTAFAALFEELALATNSENRQGQLTKFRSISTDCAGLFLLISIVERLGWADRLARLSFGAANGPRLLTYTLAGLGSEILGRFDEMLAHIDPGLALFSGWAEAPDLAGLRRFFASEPAQTRRNLLVELVGDNVTEEDSIHWQACFACLANHLVRSFAGHIRGFGRSSRSFVVKNFLALPGRIRMEETRLSIIFTSCPLNAVLHLSRLDDPVEGVAWLGGRRIEFEPYAL